MTTSMSRQADAVASGYWPLFRYRPGSDEHTHPMSLDSKAPTKPVTAFMDHETRFSMLKRADPARAEALAELAQRDADERWNYYSQLAGVERRVPVHPAPAEPLTSDEPVRPVDPEGGSHA